MFLLRLSDNQISTDKNFFLGFYSDWETLLRSEIAKMILFILFGVFFWWYEKRNYEKASKTDN